MGENFVFFLRNQSFFLLIKYANKLLKQKYLAGKGSDMCRIPLSYVHIIYLN